jgi:1-aminocyclopropane-1-carboxylate deaminase/D-cysteine desulfhydrase-like pyridoxal-dependent ACC family enzyme
VSTPPPDALARLAALPAEPLFAPPSPLDEAKRLRSALGANAPRIFVKRDDAIPFGFGGNKVRKLSLVAVEARARGADTLITVGGIQSNHMRATASTAARLGMQCVLIANGSPPPVPRANALLDALLGAEIQYVASREQRATTMQTLASRMRVDGRMPFEIPLGASTPLGAAAFARAVGELKAQLPAGIVPDAIIHATSSGGTQAGLTAGCALHGLSTRVIGISADDPASSIEPTVRGIIDGLGALAGVDGAALARSVHVSVDDTFVGEGYGIATPASREAQTLAAHTEALFVDHTYTAKALAALIAYVRAGRFRADHTIVFWHTGGQVGLFA